MPFTDRFQLLDLKRDEGARTYEAREIATGRPVLVHLFAKPTAPLNQALLAKLDALPEEERGRIIDRGEHEGGLYLVTDRLADYAGLEEWLKAKGENRAKPLDSAGAWHLKPPVAPLMNSGEHTLEIPAPPPAAPPPAKDPPGDFTRQFAAPVLRPAPSTPPVPPAKDPGEFTRLFAHPVLRPTPTPASAPPSNEPTNDPGEFTRLFAAPSPKPAPPAGEFTSLFQAPQRPAVSPKVTPVPPADPQPGEFTQMLQAQRPSVPPPKPAAQSGEFTQYFQSPMTPAAPVDAARSAPLTPPRPASHPRDAGEFTQIFGRDNLPSPPPPPTPAAPPSPSSSNATQAFAAPRPLPIQTPPAGPGEYTQMFAKPAPLTFGQAPPVSRNPEPQPIRRNSSRLPLLLVVGAFVLLVIALIVFFVIRQHSA